MYNVLDTQMYARVVALIPDPSLPGDHPGRLDGSDCVVARRNGKW